MKKNSTILLLILFCFSIFSAQSSNQDTLTLTLAFDVKIYPYTDYDDILKQDSTNSYQYEKKMTIREDLKPLLENPITLKKGSQVEALYSKSKYRILFRTESGEIAILPINCFQRFNKFKTGENFRICTKFADRPRNDEYVKVEAGLTCTVLKFERIKIKNTRNDYRELYRVRLSNGKKGYIQLKHMAQQYPKTLKQAKSHDTENIYFHSELDKKLLGIEQNKIEELLRYPLDFYTITDRDSINGYAYLDKIKIISSRDSYRNGIVLEIKEGRVSDFWSIGYGTHKNYAGYPLARFAYKILNLKQPAFESGLTIEFLIILFYITLFIMGYIFSRSKKISTSRFYLITFLPSLFIYYFLFIGVVQQTVHESDVVVPFIIMFIPYIIFFLHVRKQMIKHKCPRCKAFNSNNTVEKEYLGTTTHYDTVDKERYSHTTERLYEEANVLTHETTEHYDKYKEETEETKSHWVLTQTCRQCGHDWDVRETKVENRETRRV